MARDLRDDPVALLASVDRAAARLLAAADGLTDRQAAADSALPGWSRSHVITHVARSADVYRWLLGLARTGVEPGPRADAAALERALREGADRSAAALAADLRGSLEAMLEAAAGMPADRWPTLVSALAGWRHPAWFVLHRARRELETHHVDLAVGYTAADWPEDYVAWALDSTLAALGDRGFPLARVEAVDLGLVWKPAPEGLAVTGTGHALLGWLSGRGDGTGLATDGPLPSPLPSPPPWPQPPVPGWG
ncbi:maleylpyruvate isomerase family mycothiol-dependent enzyme [Streptacidiphilus anmyonensis]|uniref:maleylpyruvate isomerase family mycothiol-dependent enzyme n=1 Tax=Streptacidiphilus anmyonensis TaxID=405782 RepID=UPI0005A8A196|nr:maleylpyruvate isomerase family mycothiol-dependent enzyme [Streptacidiphilus anmyonensis]